jgi:hypothetical protein
MNAALFAAKQQLRSAMKQKLAALPMDAVKEQSTSSPTGPQLLVTCMNIAGAE